MTKISIIISSDDIDSEIRQTELSLLCQQLQDSELDFTLYSDQATPIDSLAVQALSDLDATDTRAALFLGKFTYESLDTHIKAFIQSLKSSQKHMAFIGLSALLAAEFFDNPRLTVGLNPKYMDLLDKKTELSLQSNADDVLIDSTNNIYSTPAYLIEDATDDLVTLGFKKLISYISSPL